MEDDDVRFSDKVLGDVKRVIALMLFSIIRFYQIQPHIEYEEELNQASSKIFDYIKDRLIKEITKTFI